ncbi:MAG: RNA polymerase sigma factor, partial [Solirubrobacteraceae bacterium]
ARNRSLNHLRRASAIGVDSMDVHYAENGLSTGDKVMRRESFRELIADVHELPETQRTALLLREIDALSYEQIAHAMETTVPSVKSLLVRARISLAEAAEARKLSCEDVRLELGEVAEGLGKLSTPARRHVRGCERCAFFRKQLKDNNRALALIMPVGPLLLVKKLLLAKLGSTASAGGAHVAGGAGAVGATATASAGAGAAAGGGGVAGGIMTAGAGALATKAVAGLAVAAIVTAGAVATDNAVVVHHHPHVLASASVAANHYASEPLVVHQALQPVSAGTPASPTPVALARRNARHTKRIKVAPSAPTPPSPTVPIASTGAVTAPPAKPAVTPPVSEVTTQTTELPAAATTVPSTTPGTATTTTPSTSTPAGTTTPSTPTTTTTTTTTATTTVETPPAPTQNATAGADDESSAETGAATSQVIVAPGTGGTEAPATGKLGDDRAMARASRHSDRTGGRGERRSR